MLKVKIGKSPRLSQGDVVRNVEYIEYVSEKSGNIEVSKIVFPLAIVLTQDCDLAQDYKFRWSKSDSKYPPAKPGALWVNRSKRWAQTLGRLKAAS